MVINWIVDVFLDIAEFIAGWFPSTSADILPAGFLSGLSSLAGLFNVLDGAIPVSTLFLALGAYFAIYGALHGANLIRRVVSLFSGGGGA